MKISNKLIMGALWLSYYLNPPARDVDAIYAHAKKHNEKQTFKVPRYRNIDCEDLIVRTDSGNYHCLRMRRKGQEPERLFSIFAAAEVFTTTANCSLFSQRNSYGGSMLKSITRSILPSTKYPIKETYKMIFETYRYMLSRYSHHKTGYLACLSGQRLL